MRVFVIIVLMILAGCGTRHYKQFDLSNVHESQGVIIGKVEVEYNFRPFDSTGCEFCVGSACQYLLDDGYVFIPVEKGPLTQGHLSCSYPDLCCEDLIFTVKSFEVDSGIIYFGNMIFVVDSKRSHAKNPFPPGSRDTAQNVYDYSNYQDPYDYSSPRRFAESFVEVAVEDMIYNAVTGELFSDDDSSQRVPYKIYFSVSVKDRMASVLEVFHTQVLDEDIKVEKNLFKAKLVTKEKTAHELFFK